MEQCAIGSGVLRDGYSRIMTYVYMLLLHMSASPTQLLDLAY